MKQVVQSVSKGLLKLVDLPQPEPGPAEVLVATRRSLLSAGTERAVRELAAASLFQKARARPDLVRQVLSRARTEGAASTLTAVRTRLDDEMPLGYSGAGVAVSVGEYVSGVRPGMRVATASAGHGEYQVVPGLLTVPIPDEVSDAAAAFGAVAAIALQGLRQADVGVGGTVCVIGLGLVGQLTVRLALASGLNVAGIDLRSWTAQLATSSGAIGLVEAGQATTDQIRDLTRGRGVDAVLLTAATPSSSPVTRATDLTRDRGRLVVVGDIGLELNRRPFYEQELEIRFARSYGPGRYERSYEEWGVDLPVGHVRWTEGRNIEAYLNLVARGRVTVDDLITHTFRIENAADAYATMQSETSSLAIQLSYDAPATVTRAPVARHFKQIRRAITHPRAGVIGAGNYARSTFLPALLAAGWSDSLMAVTSSRGLTSRHLAERYDIPLVVPDASALIDDEDIDVVFILSRHDSHADLVVQALESGKHVFTEKPLALTEEELARVAAAYEISQGQLFVGFNRRFSEAATLSKEMFIAGRGPLAVSYRINAGKLPATHWYKDRRQGGRLLGEVCHFVDFGQFLVGQPAESIAAFAHGRDEALLDEDYLLSLSYPDGSTVSITYVTTAHPGTPKERIDIFGQGHTVLIDDFKRVEIDGKIVKNKTMTKGHVAQLAAMRQALTSGTLADGFETSAQATQTTLAAQRSLLSGH